MSRTSKIILVTGATSGIGRATALHLAKRGHHVLASGRKLGELASLYQEAAGLRLDTLVLDVTSAASIAHAVEAVEQLTGGRGIDVLINNAGFGVLGPTSEIDDTELRRQYDTNVFGLMSVTRAFLPAMRARRAGRIINVSSVGGRITLPLFGAYNSTKYAIESLSDALRYELHPFGIDVALIEPGVIRTSFEATAVSDLARFEATPYAPVIESYERMSRAVSRFAADPSVVATAITRAVEARRAAARYVAPRTASLLIWMRALLPTRTWDWAMRTAGVLDGRLLEPAAPAPSAVTSPPTRRRLPCPAGSAGTRA